MNSINSIIIEGNLTQAPVFRETSKGTSLCHFSIASNRYYKQDSGVENEVSFFDVQSWGKLAENVNAMGHKGRGVRVVGRLKQERWIDTSGKNCSKIIIVAEHIEFRSEAKQSVATERETSAMPEETEDEVLDVNW